MYNETSTLYITPDDEAFPLKGLHQLEQLPDEQWWRPWRLPHALLPRSASERLDERARTATGARWDVDTDATSASIRLYGAPDSAPADLVVDGALYAREPVAVGPQLVRMALPDGRHRIEIWLPQFGPSLIGALTLDGATTVLAPPPPELRWATYGSSLTQCRTAAGPAQTWPAIVARTLNWDLTNLGFGGECHLDPIAAGTLRDTPLDLVSLCLGINIFMQGSFTSRTLPAAVCAFIDTVRIGHPTAPIVVVTPVAAPAQEGIRNSAGLTLADVRSIVERSVAELRRLGDTVITIVDGREIFGASDASMLVDEVHPSAEGYQLIGARMTLVLRDAAGPVLTRQNP